MAREGDKSGYIGIGMGTGVVEMDGFGSMSVEVTFQIVGTILGIASKTHTTFLTG